MRIDTENLRGKLQLKVEQNEEEDEEEWEEKEDNPSLFLWPTLLSRPFLILKQSSKASRPKLTCFKALCAETRHS